MNFTWSDAEREARRKLDWNNNFDVCLFTDILRKHLRDYNVLSVGQPFANLIINGDKFIETRSWKTSYRGELLIYGSNGKGVNKVLKEKAKEIRKKHGNGLVGYVIGKVELVDCVKMTQEFIDSLSEKEKSLGHYQVGRYAWIFKNAERIDPIPAVGKLGLWKIEGVL